MKAYGVRKHDKGCCPGHDKYPSEPYRIKRRNTFKMEDRPRKKHARQEAKRLLYTIIGAD